MAEPTHSIVDQPLYLLKFGMMNILEYGEKVSRSYGDKSVSGHRYVEVNKKGLAMFKEKFVSSIRFKTPNHVNDFFTVYAKVKAEMRKKVNYDVEVKINHGNNEILELKCECPAGRNPALCKHSYALLYALDEYSTREMYYAPTEKLQTWHQPRPRKVTPKKAKELFGKKHSHVQLKSSVNWSALQNLSPMFNVAANAEDIKYSMTLPLPAIAYAGKLSEGLPSTLTFEETLFLHTNLVFSVDDAIMLEKKTVGQCSNELWRKERKSRLTASKFGLISKRQSAFEALAMQVYESNFKDLSHIPAIAHGRKFEGYVKNILKNIFSNFMTRETGLVTHPLYPYLGASSDGLMHTEDDIKVIEIKCSYNPENLSLGELLKRSSFCLEEKDGILGLKKSHEYYYQVQGQMGLSGLKKCLFSLFYKRNEPLCVKEVDFDEEFFQTMVEKLKNFYFDHYLKKLMNC